ncbi:hypothetical protein HYW40_00425 [Candidatus Curtissbacteria bacterium]|nr:hypothetical protein [Candidatus Curtissbacteria bacterium]
MKYPSLGDLWKLDTIAKSRPIKTNGQSRILGRFRQLFPLTFFPDELLIEELRVVWVKKMGPWTTEIVSIMATDIACVYASRGLVIGQIHIKSLTGGPEIRIDKIFGSHAYRARNLIEGIALASREGLKVEETNLESEKAGLIRAGEVRSSLFSH